MGVCTGQTKKVEALPARSLLPDTNYYLTYEGSLTQPGCHETVTWVLFNKPIYVARTQVLRCNIIVVVEKVKVTMVMMMMTTMMIARMTTKMVVMVMMTKDLSMSPGHRYSGVTSSLSSSS